MRQLGITKLCVNICVGESGDRLTRAAKVLEQLTGQTPVFSKGKLSFLSAFSSSSSSTSSSFFRNILLARFIEYTISKRSDLYIARMYHTSIQQLRIDHFLISIWLLSYWTFSLQTKNNKTHLGTSCWSNAVTVAARKHFFVINQNARLYFLDTPALRGIVSKLICT